MSWRIRRLAHARDLPQSELARRAHREVRLAIVEIEAGNTTLLGIQISQSWAAFLGGPA